MNSYVETLNHWGENFLSFAWPMFWQSSLLIAALFTFDLLFRRKLRATLRYALWLVVLVKLCLPTTLASPTSPAWWLLRKNPPSVVVKSVTHYTVTYDNTPLPEIPQMSLPAFVPPKPAMTLAAWLLVISISISGALWCWLLVRWWQITLQTRRAAAAEHLISIAEEAQKLVGLKFKVRVKLTANSMSPAVCGLFRPAILIPQSLAENFSAEQLRAVLLHELIHLRRRDVWLNFAQALLQIFYWWHPLLWFANARIRRVREEAVDDAVMLALRDDADAYAPTLLEVAKLALNRPLASLGLVGIMESRHALRQRIERLVDFRPPRRAGLTLVSLLGILAFTAVAVPMGEGPAETNNLLLPVIGNNLNLTNSNVSESVDSSSSTNAAESPITMIFKIERPVRSDELKKVLLDAGVKIPPTIFFYQDNGTLLVRGSQDQLALVNRLVLKQNGYSPNEIAVSDKKFIEQMGFAASDLQTTINLAIRMSKLEEAEKLIKQALALDPENADAKYFLGLVQSDYNRFAESLVQYVKTNQFKSEQQIAESKLTAVRVVQQGKRIYEKGDLDLAERPLNLELAERLFQLASNLDPENADAKYYLGLVQAARQTPNASAHTNLIYTSPARQAIGQKLQTIRLDRVAFDATPLSDVIRILAEGSQKNDLDRKGINFMLNQPVVTPTIDPSTGLPAATNAIPAVDLRSLPITISPALTNISLGDALDAVLKAAPELIKYSVLDYAIEFSPKGPDVPEYYTRTFAVGTGFFVALKKISGVQTDEGSVIAARDYFKTLGVDLELPGKSIFYNSSGDFFVRATSQDLDIIKTAIQKLNSVTPQTDVVATNSFGAKMESVQDGRLLYEMGKLDEAEVKFKAVLAVDPENGWAIKFLKLVQSARQVSKTAESPITMTFKLNAIRPDDLKQLLLDAGVTNPPTVYFYQENNGLMLVRGSAEQLALVNRVVLKLNGRSTNEIEAVDKQFIKQTGTNGFQTQATTNLYTRNFKVDPNIFLAALKKATGLQSSNVLMLATKFFSTLGVELTTTGKSIFFNDRLGMLLVRATDQDLDMIERAVQTLTQAPPQVHIKARFVEVTRDKNGASAFDWYLGQFSNMSNHVAGKVAIASPPDIPVSAANPAGVFPGNTISRLRGLSSSNLTIASITGILTETNLRVVLRALENRPGFQQLAEPEAVTTSGRQVQMRVTDIRTIVTKYSLIESGTNSAMMPQQESIETGPILDTVARVLADGYTINLTAIPSLTEFLGYDEATNTIAAYTKAGQKIDLPDILPSFYIRQAVANLNIWDGQTVVLGNFPKKFIVSGKEVSAEPDSFVKANKAKGRPDVNDKELLVFITATIIDAAGNRVHSDEEMSAKTGVPVQPSPSPSPK